MQGEHDKALNSYLELWDALPEPKQGQPEQIANWLILCIFNNYFDREKFLEAKKWALIGLNNDTAKHDSYEYIQIGCVCYESGEFDEAMKYFSVAYERGKKEHFNDLIKNIGSFILKTKNDFLGIYKSTIVHSAFILK